MKKVRIIPTWEMTREKWLTARTVGIGGSEAGTICGVNKYKSPYALWAEKLGLVERQQAGEPAKWGNRLERVVAEAYAEDYTKAVVAWPVILVSQEEEHPFMLANVDFFIVESSEEFPEGQVTTWRSESEPPGIKGILEVKTAGIASPGAPHLWSNNAIPQSYMLQAIHYGIVTGIYDITFAALIGGQGLITRELEWDDEIAENLIIAEGQFWDLLQNEIPPATDGSDATEAAQQSRYPRHTPGKGYEGGPEFLELWSRYNAAKEASDAADAERKSFRAEIIELIGDSEFATVNGKTVLTYRASKDSEALDIDRIKREAPEIWERFKKVRSGARIMRAVNK